MELWQAVMNFVFIGIASIYWKWPGFIGSIVGAIIYHFFPVSSFF